MSDHTHLQSIETQHQSDPSPPNPSSPPANIGWYLLQTKPRQESLALENLQRQGYTCHLPTHRQERIRRRKKQVFDEALFPSYLFIQLDSSLSGQSWAPIRSTFGVRRLIRFGDQPARVDNRLIDTLRECEQARMGTPERLFNPGESVVITEGPFAGIEAIYQMEEAEQRSIVLLEMIRKQVSMRIDTASLRKLK